MDMLEAAIALALDHELIQAVIAIIWSLLGAALSAFDIFIYSQLCGCANLIVLGL